MRDMEKTVPRFDALIYPKLIYFGAFTLNIAYSRRIQEECSFLRKMHFLLLVKNEQPKAITLSRAFGKKKYI